MHTCVTIVPLAGAPSCQVAALNDELCTNQALAAHLAVYTHACNGFFLCSGAIISHIPLRMASELVQQNGHSIDRAGPIGKMGLNLFGRGAVVDVADKD